jgi:hypothetical protein
MGLFGFDFYPILAPKRKSAPKQAVFSLAFCHRAFVGRDEYTGATIPRKATPAVCFQKICPVLLLAPRVACPLQVPSRPRLLPDLRLRCALQSAIAGPSSSTRPQVRDSSSATGPRHPRLPCRSLVRCASRRSATPLVHHAPSAPTPLGRPRRDVALNAEHELCRAPSLPCYAVNAAPHLNTTERRQLLRSMTPERCSLSLSLSRMLRMSLQSGPFLSRSERGNFTVPPLRSASSFRSDEVVAIFSL